MLKNDFFGFPKVKWLHLTGEVDKSVRYPCQIFSGFNIPKIIKNRLIFDRVIQKRWNFWGHSVGYVYLCVCVFAAICFDLQSLLYT